MQTQGKYQPLVRRIEYHPKGKVVVKCGALAVSVCDQGMWPHMCATLMEDAERLRWILREIDLRVGGTVCNDVAEETQDDYEELVVE